jgi:hypothetical protein
MANLQAANSDLCQNIFFFPMQCRQVFFSDDKKYSATHGGDWKVVCGTDVRGRRRDWHNVQLDIEILDVGRDSDFEGLRLRFP